MTAATRGPRTYAMCALIGLLAGFLSGMFGVGGGTVIVPMLVLLLGFNQRLAAGTSLGAIVPTATVGVISYAVHGSVAWIAALILAAGAVVGAQIGTHLLRKISQALLRWGFIAFLLVVIVMLFVVIPSRGATFELHWVSGMALLGTGIATGILAGLIGVGGGVIVVPVLMVAFGTSDLVAKGTSLLMMIPTSISGTVSNLRHRNIDIVAAVVVGLSACLTTALGAWLANLVDPVTGNILFAAYLLVIAAQLARKATGTN